MTDIQKEQLTIAIDESGNFQGDKLLGQKSKSTVVAVMSYLSKNELRYELNQLCKMHNVSTLSHLHAMELRDRYGEGVAHKVIREMNQLNDGKIAILSQIKRMVFNEQQAYGETLFALLRQIAITWKNQLQTAKRISIIIATRGHGELMGFTDKDDYHDAFIELIKQKLPHMNWPKVHDISFKVATKNPFLMLADFAAFRSTKGSYDWVFPMGELSNIDDERKFRSLLNQQMPALSWMNLIAQDKTLPIRQNIKKRGIEKVEAILLSLIGLARQHLDTRHQDGDLHMALKICDSIWDSITTMTDFKRHDHTFKVQCCFIALETLSHLGATPEDEKTLTWQSRRATLTFSDPFDSLKTDFELKLHEAQHLYFNIFKFEDAYLEVLEWYQYYLQLTQSFDTQKKDQILGRILGTMGQAAGFLRAIDPTTAAESLSWLQQSATHFMNEPHSLFAHMNIGYQCTELWDSHKLDMLSSFIDQHIPKNTSTKTPWNALHYCRFFALKKEYQGLTDDENDLIRDLRNYVFQYIKTTEHLAHPCELLVKWSLYLYPNDLEMKALMVQRLKEESSIKLLENIAIKATILPLLTQLQIWEQVATHVEALLNIPAFVIFWNSDRMRHLKEDIASQTTAHTFEALTAMPWNYS